MRGPAGVRRFAAAGRAPYADDPGWTPPLPGEERATFDPRRNPSLERTESARWVLDQAGAPVGRVAAFAPRQRPDVGYFGFFESPDDPAAAGALLGAAEEWLRARGRRVCYGPIAVVPRDRIGLLIDGFDHPAVLFTPYNPRYYAALLARVGYAPHRLLLAYGWSPGFDDPSGALAAAERTARATRNTIRPIRMDRLREETRTVAGLLDRSLAEAWHYDPIGEREASDLARLLRPVLDPAIALVAEDDAGPCGAALAVPDVNWLWRRAGGRLWPLGWARLLRWRRRIPVVRLIALGIEPRVRGTALALRLIAALNDAGRRRGYRRGEMSQVFEENTRMRRMLDRMGFPVVRRYAVYARSLSS